MAHQPANSSTTKRAAAPCTWIQQVWANPIDNGWHNWCWMGRKCRCQLSHIKSPHRSRWKMSPASLISLSKWNLNARRLLTASSWFKELSAIFCTKERQILYQSLWHKTSSPILKNRLTRKSTRQSSSGSAQDSRLLRKTSTTRYNNCWREKVKINNQSSLYSSSSSSSAKLLPFLGGEACFGFTSCFLAKLVLTGEGDT